MTEEKDGAVHYQVSVTGRQAAAFFLVLLAALGLSFFLGMKTGAAARRGPDSVSALAAQSDIAVPTVPSGPEASGKASPEPTEPPIGFGAPAPAPKRAVAESAEAPVKVEEKAQQKEESAPAKEDAKKSARPTELATTAAEKAETVPVKEGAASKKGEGPFWVQIVVTSNAQKADSLSKKLKADGFSPVVSPVTAKKGLSFRVRIGPFPDHAKAEAAAKKVEKTEKLLTKPIVVPGK